MPVNFQIGIFPDRTRIVDHKIRLFLRGLLIANLFQNPRKLLRIPGIHLAAEGGDVEGKGTPQAFLLLFQKFPAFSDKIVLPFRLLCRRIRTGIRFVKFYMMKHFMFSPF